MRQMADAVTPATFPWADLVAGYCDGRYQSYEGMAAANPGKKAVSIATQASTRGADVYDCEAGDFNAPQLATAIRDDRAGGRNPTAYFSEASRATVETTCSVFGLSLPPEWIAGYPGSVGYGRLYSAPCVAHQDADQGDCDHSTVADYWPGVDSQPAAPAAPPESEEESTMQVLTYNGNLNTVFVDKNANLVQKAVSPSNNQWGTTIISGEIEGNRVAAGKCFVDSSGRPTDVGVNNGFEGNLHYFALAEDGVTEIHATWVNGAWTVQTH